MVSLHDLAQRGDDAELERWLASSGPLDGRDGEGNTPLHGAAGRGHRACVELLIARGANPSLPNSDGLTPLELAVRKRQLGVTQVLLAVNAAYDARGILLAATEFSGTQDPHRLVELLLEHRAELNEPDAQGRTPLHHAVIAGYERSAALLVRRGARLESKDG